MPPAPLPPNEAERLASLQACAILDTPSDPRFDAITRLAARLYGAPIALVSLVDEARQWFKSAHGCIQAGTEVGRDIAVCAHAILTPGKPFVIEDLTRDPRFVDNPLVTGELGLRAYAGMPLRDAAGRALGVLCVVDVTPRRFSAGEVEMLCDLAMAVSSMLELCRSAEALRESEEHYRCAVELNPLVPWTADRGGQMQEASQRMAALTRLRRENLAGMGWMEAMHPNDLATIVQQWSRCVRSGAPYDSEHRMRLADGTYCWFRARASPRRGADGGIVRWYGTAEDVTERRRSQAQVAHMAHHDALTGLANRALFRERLDQQLAVASGDARLAVLTIDLDNFKAVNHTLGHPVGDGLLQQVASRLRGCVRDTDTVARFGGDEFMIVQAGLVNPGEAAKLAQRIIDALGAPYQVDGHMLDVSASVGVVLALDGGTQPDGLIRNADFALYRAKAEGRGTYRLFDAAMDERVQTRSALKLDLHGALARREFEIVYQPIVNLRSGRVTCFEALLRWRHPRRGHVSPAEFIPPAEETGLVGPIGEWVLEQACCQAASWPEGVGVAVNLSPVQFRNRDLPERIAAALVRTGLAPGRLELEITESVPLLDDDTNLSILHALRSLGIRIAMDDFGTGYSSLGYLNRFPFDKLKIDRSFVSQLSEAAESYAIVRAVVGLSRALRIVTTAEGVETPHQLDRLRAEGCDQAQGYLFSRPVPHGDVPALIRTLQAAEPTWPERAGDEITKMSLPRRPIASTKPRPVWNP